MRSGLVWIVLLIALAGLGWLLFGGGEPAGQGGSGEHAEDAGDGDVEASGPLLEGGGAEGRPRVPSDIRGRGTIQGVVRRAGAPLGAVVELRHVATVDPRNPFEGGVETMMIARMLDSGVSRKDVIARTEAGDDGRFSFRGLATGLYEIRATAANGGMGFASASLPAHGARVEASIEIPNGDAGLAGRIVYADGRPFRGMVVLTTGEGFAALMGGGGKVRPSATDAEGGFTVAGLPPGRYQVSAIIPGVMRVMGAPVAVPHDGDYLLTINAAGVDVKGKVIAAATEEAIAGATVFGGGGDPSSMFSIYSTRSGADGTFAMTLPGGRGGGMFVKAEGFAPQTVDFDGAAGGEVVVSMLALSRLSGRVTAKEGGAAVAGVTVFATGSRRGGMMPIPATAITDADGRYAISGVSPGAVKVHALGAGWASVGMSGEAFGETQTPYTIELEPGDEGTLDLETLPAGKVDGHVLTQEGRPVPGAVVQAVGGGNSVGLIAAFSGLGAGYGAVVTDADGAYEIDVLVPGSTYGVLARAPDHPDARSDGFQAVAGKTERVDLRMQVPRFLEVTVIDAEGGAPVAGATIMALPKDGAGMDMGRLMGGGSSWTTGSDGSARLGPLAEGELRLRVAAAGYVASDNEDVAADRTSPLTVELTQGLVIAGRVVMPTGVPAQSIRVTISSNDQGGGWYHERPAVHADGSFAVDNIEHAGTYEIRARGQWEDRAYTGNTEADAGTTGVEILLDVDKTEERSTLVVSVLDHEGKPVPSGRVQIWRFEGKNSRSTNTKRLNSGKAQFRGLKTDGELWVEVYELVGSRRGATIQGPVTITGSTLEVRLEPPLQIAGVILGPDGQGVAGTRVVAHAQHPRPGTKRRGNEHGSAVSDTDGRFEIKGLGNLDYQLLYTAPADYAPVPAEIVRAGRVDVVTTLQAGLRAILTVLDYEGKPVAGAQVGVRNEAKNAPARSRTTGMNVSGTNADGQFTLRGLPAGATFTLSISGPGGRTDLKSIAVKGWAPADATFRFVRAFRISGVVVNQHGKPAPNVSVRVRKAGTKDWKGWNSTNQEGEFSIGDLEHGRYEVKAQGQGMQLVSHPRAPGQPAAPEPGVVEARAGATGVKITIDLGSDLTVKVRGVSSRAGRGGNAFLRPMEGQGGFLHGSFSSSSTVKFRGLRPETAYRLWIGGLPGGMYVLVEDVRAQAEALSVTAKEGGTITGTVRAPPGEALSGTSVNCHDARGIGLAAVVDPKTGAFTIEGLPEGTFTVSAGGRRGDGERWHAQATTSTGGRVTLELKKGR